MFLNDFISFYLVSKALRIAFSTVHHIKANNCSKRIRDIALLKLPNRELAAILNFLHFGARRVNCDQNQGFVTPPFRMQRNSPTLPGNGIGLLGIRYSIVSLFIFLN